MLKKYWKLIAVIAVVCMLAACSVPKPALAPEEVAAVLTEPTEPSRDRVTEPAQEAATQATFPEEPAQTEHIHSWVETVIAPTCTAQGYTQHTCDTCGETLRDNFTGPDSHAWDSWQTVTEATEDADGKAERSCYSCGKTESRVIPMLPPAHVHSYTGTVTAEPTCTKAGTKTFVCPCGDCYTDALARLSHTYVSTTVPATCTLRGYDVFTCTGCGDTYQDHYTPPAAHSYSASVTKPTCTEAGFTTYTCTCGDSYVSNSVAATGHSWGSWKTTVAATITSTGLRERSCSCGAKETEVIGKIPHTHSHTGKVTTPAKCETDGMKTFTCSCGDSYTETIPASGHSWGSWKTTAEPTYSSAGSKQRSCSVCKAVQTEQIPRKEHSHSMVHIKTKPTCTAEGYTTHKCSLCDYSYVDTRVPANGHSWSQWVTVTPATDISTGLARRTCSVCGTAEDKTLPKDPNAHSHSFIGVERVEPTCTADGYLKKVCSCGATTTETLPAAHNWQHHHEDEVGHYNVYIVCHCGWRCSAEGDYIAKFAGHVSSLPVEERYTHSYYDTGVWVVDIPAKDWDQCTVCGATN